MKSEKIIILFLFACLFIGCEMHHEPEQQASLKMEICLPIENKGMAAPRRIIGDPGTSEQFELPRYIYIFVLKKINESWSIWRKEERVLSPELWEQTHYTGHRLNYRDSVFHYKYPIHFFLNNESPKGKVYAICSHKRLMNIASSMASITTADAVINLTFNTAPDSIQENLQNIYATPYNYEVNDEYYCAYDCSAGNSSVVDLILYHVAAKVDITWNVVDTMRINKDDPDKAVRLTSMKACNLFNSNAYCFKPLENSSGASPLATGKTITLVEPEDEGLWWEGRSYFYTIPYTTTSYANYFPLQMQMETNESGDTYQPTIYMEIDKSSPFVPWLRANYNLTDPLPEDNSVVKIVTSEE